MSWEPVKYELKHEGGDIGLSAKLRLYPGCDPPVWLVSVVMETDTYEHRACWLANDPDNAMDGLASFVEGHHG